MCTHKKLIFTLALLWFVFPLISQNPKEGAREVYSTTVYFDFAKYNIRPSAYNRLTELAMKSFQLEKYRIDVTAHTDSIGTLERNYKLSENRAEAVRSYLIKEGVPRTRIFTGVMGEYEPATQNDSEEARQQNRRATVTLYEIVPVSEVKETVYLTDTIEKIREVKIVEEVPVEVPAGQDVTVEEPENPVVEMEEVEVVTEPEIMEEPEDVIVEEPEEVVIEEPEDVTVEIMLDGPQKVEPEEELSLEDPGEEVVVGQTIELKSIYFEGDSDQLLIASEPQLKNLLNFMSANPNVKIEIAGHINYQDVLLKRDSPDFQLSVNRAKAVYDYLINNGIGPERMAYQGYGNWQMRFPNPESEFEAAQNRRVEIKILEN